MGKILFPAQEKYLHNLIEEEDTLISEMEEFAKTNKVPILSKDSAQFLEQLVHLTKPQRVLELGTAIAYSTIRIARNLNKKSVVHSIEKSKDNITIAKKNIKKSGQESKIHLFEGNALNIMTRLDKKYDLIFLDADKTDYKKLFDYSMILLKRGGIIFVDNLLWKGYAASNSKIPTDQRNSAKIIRDFNRVFISHPKLKSSILPVGDGIGLGIKY